MIFVVIVDVTLRVQFIDEGYKIVSRLKMDD